MKYNKVILMSLMLIMGLFSCFKKSDANEDQNKNEILLGMILLGEENSMKIGSVVDELRTRWKLKVDDKESTDESSVLIIGDYHVAIGNMPMPIPGNEVNETAEYNYFWENGQVETAQHKGHIIVSILNGGKNAIKENILFNYVVASILNNSNSLGVYIGGRTLLLKKDFYLANLENISETDLPIYNLVYFGIRRDGSKNSVYTYGLKDFRKLEIEIIDSELEVSELMDMMYNLASYVITNNVTLKDGETIGVSEEQKLKIEQSKGKFLEGSSLKIHY